MKFEEARAQVISAIQFASSALNEELIASKLADNGADLAFSELELDSLAAMELCIEIEDKTGVEIDLGDLALHASVNDLAKLMVARSPAHDR
jgi:acyl carrier protein